MAAFPELTGYLAAAVTTVSFVPQVLKTLRTRDTRAISLGMYALFSLGVALWLVYGILIDALARDPGQCRDPGADLDRAPAQARGASPGARKARHPTLIA
jgi:MtN3 and saliva related transmembrane protein